MASVDLLRKVAPVVTCGSLQIGDLGKPAWKSQSAMNKAAGVINNVITIR